MYLCCGVLFTEDTRLDQLIVALVSRTGDKTTDSQAITTNAADATVTNTLYLSDFTTLI